MIGIYMYTMLFILFFIFVTWLITNIILSVTESIILQLKPNAGTSAKVYSIIITSFIVLILYFNFSVLVDIDKISIFNMTQDQANNPKSNSFGVKVISNTFGTTSEFDTQNISDVLLVTAVGKLSIQAMSTVFTTKSKVIVGATTTLSLGAVGTGYKFMNPARHNLREYDNTPVNNLNSRPLSPVNENFISNSPLENLSSSESLIWHYFVSNY